MATKSHSSYRGGKWETRNANSETAEHLGTYVLAVGGWGQWFAVRGKHTKASSGALSVLFIWRRVPVQPVTPPLGFELWVVWVHPNSYFEFENIFSRWIISLHIAASKWEQTTHSNDLVNLIFWKLQRISCPWNMDTFPSPSAPLPPTLARLRAIIVVLF